MFRSFENYNIPYDCLSMMVTLTHIQFTICLKHMFTDGEVLRTVHFECCRCLKKHYFYFFFSKINLNEELNKE